MATDFKKFAFYQSFYEVIDEFKNEGDPLTVEEEALYYRAIVHFMFMGEELRKELPLKARLCFQAIKPNLIKSRNTMLALKEKHEEK